MGTALFFFVAVSLLLGLLGLSLVITKALGSLARSAWTFAFKSKPAPFLSVPGLTATWLAVVFVAPMQGCNYLQAKLYEDAIPPELEIVQLAYHDEQSGLREGCGAAVFELSEKNLAEIRKQGLAYFDGVTQGRDGDPYHRYEAWRPLPPPGDSNDARLLRGASCLDDPPALWEAIERSVHTGEGYFTTGREHDLIVLPERGVIVFSHNG